MKRCFRCGGRKKIYKVGAGYSMTDMGGVEVTCPLCSGEGNINPPVVVKKRKSRAKYAPVESIQRAVDSVSKDEAGADASRL